MTPDAFALLIKKLCALSDPLQKRAYELITTLTRDALNCGILLARSAQHTVVRGTTLYKQLSEHLSPTEIDILSILNEGPLSQSLLLNLCLWSPVTASEVKEANNTSFSKELAATMRRRREKSQINWRTLFSDSAIEPLCIHHPVNEPITRKVRKILNRWRSSMKNRVLYPTLSNKSMSRETLERFNEEFPEEKKASISQVEYERVLHEKPFSARTSSELRQKHYTGFFKPRTYYAMGTYHHTCSKYLSSPLSELTNLFEFTHKRLAVDPTRLESSDGSPLFIYDLRSFTSNLDEHAHFLDEFSMYCKGTPVFLMTPVEGLIEADLGTLIALLRDCHDCPLFDISKFLPGAPFQCGGPGGILGVRGNIQTAKLLHGIVLAHNHKSFGDLNVAGDDGASVDGDHVVDFNTLLLLGDLAKEKVFTTAEPGAVCLKRSIVQRGKHFIHGSIVSLPNFEYPLATSDVDLRYPSIRQMSKNERRKSAAASLLSSAMSCTGKLDIQEAKIYLEIVRMFYDYSGLPLEGSIPQCGGAPIGLVPPFASILRSNSLIIDTIYMRYRGQARLKTREHLTQEVLYEEQDTFLANSSPHLKYLETLGYLEKEPVYEIVVGSQGLMRLLLEFTDPIPPVWSYTVVQDVPLPYRVS